jgi:hypothetical protein
VSKLRLTAYIIEVFVDPIILFLASGFVSMSTALSANVLNKIPTEKREGFFATHNGALFVVMMGNIAAATLVFAMAYGFRNLHWALPLSCMFFSFPLVHILVIQKLLGGYKGLLTMMIPTLVAPFLLYIYW